MSDPVERPPSSDAAKKIASDIRRISVRLAQLADAVIRESESSALLVEMVALFERASNREKKLMLDFMEQELRDRGEP